MSDGFHAADDGSLARSTGGAAARGALLIALAVVIGLLLLTFALNDSSTEVVVDETEQADEENTEGSEDGNDVAVAAGDSSDTDDEAGTDADADTSADADGDAESIPEETIDAGAEDRSASEVNVLVANGVGTSGIAGATADVLIADGYIGIPADAPTTATSVILYKEGFDADALAVAAVLGAPPDVVQPVAADGSLPIDQDAIADGRGETANVLVILGSDGVVPPG